MTQKCIGYRVYCAPSRPWCNRDVSWLDTGSGFTLPRVKPPHSDREMKQERFPFELYSDSVGNVGKFQQLREKAPRFPELGNSLDFGALVFAKFYGGVLLNPQSQNGRR